MPGSARIIRFLHLAGLPSAGIYRLSPLPARCRNRCPPLHISPARSRHNQSSTLLSDGGWAGSCERTSILLTINNQVVDGLVHRLQVFHIVELYQERQPLMLVQIVERRLSRHREAFAKSMHRSCKVWYLILAHSCSVSLYSLHISSARYLSLRQCKSLYHVDCIGTIQYSFLFHILSQVLHKIAGAKGM